jgi:hypothetical protein
MEKPTPPKKPPRKPAPAGPTPGEGAPPQVIADIEFREGVFTIHVQNISDQPAYQVSVRWTPPFNGLGGTQPTSKLPLFQGIPFLAPHKTISTMLDTSQAYFGRNEPTRLKAEVRYRDEAGRERQAVFEHNLEIYRDVAYINLTRSLES